MVGIVVAILGGCAPHPESVRAAGATAAAPGASTPLPVAPRRTRRGPAPSETRYAPAPPETRHALGPLETKGGLASANGPAFAVTRASDGRPTGPQLYSVSVVPSVVHAGDAVHWDARVSPDVTTVTCRVAVYTFALYAVRHGHFGVTFAIPKDVPPFFHGKYAVTVTASAGNGASTARVVPLSFE